jgi:hypothetical protein
MGNVGIIIMCGPGLRVVFAPSRLTRPMRFVESIKELMKINVLLNVLTLLCMVVVSAGISVIVIIISNQYVVVMGPLMIMHVNLIVSEFQCFMKVSVPNSLLMFVISAKAVSRESAVKTERLMIMNVT